MDFESREFRTQGEPEILLPAEPSSGSRSLRAEPSGPGCGTVVPVILSGGCGSRLWPYSTEETPKQFLSITGAKSLFRMTLDRVRDRGRFQAPVIVGSLRHARLCERELTEQDEGARLVLEPCARNTAAAIAMAALSVREMHGDDALLLIMPSDHVIQDLASFHAAVATGEEAAHDGRLVTFGIHPTAPETGFGYIHVGADLPGTASVKTALRFVEKPPLETAEKMIADGNHVWNAGIFLFRAGTFLDELKLYAPAIASAAERAVALAKRDGDRIVPDLGALAECPSESVDYAVMEHSSRVAVVPMSPGWSDLGSWDALAELVKEAEQLGPITAVDCDDCYIRSDGLHVAALGVRDLIIVVAGQRLLIVPRGRAQEVKKLLLAMDSMAA